MSYDGIPEDTMCQRCRTHKATITRANSVLEYVHGHYAYWCECCDLKEAIRLAHEHMAQLGNLQVKLRSACTTEVQPDPDALIRQNERLHDELDAQWVAAHCMICGQHYPGRNAMNYAAPHNEGEHCYWPKPEELIAW